MLILIAHGSRDRRWRSSVERVVDSLRRELGEDTVRLAYMERTPPTLEEVVSEAVAGGVTGLKVLPLFLAEEGHVERDIRPLVDSVRRAFPGAQIEQLPPVGQDPEFREALARIAQRTLEESGIVSGRRSWETEPRPHPGRWGWWAP
ncbi:MAG: CbiX/SirB N-terminal domain-containing protein [Gemmatimonadetes bacterium]|nr:CbiX/SirB N-terminal domain-containing protein [Gemmatimonadota bacterium]